MSPRCLARVGITITGGVLFVASCGGSDRPATTATTSAWMVMNDDAAMRLANARCERDLECDDIGPGKRFADRDTCTRELGNEARIKLRAHDCPSGIDDQRLATCLNRVRAERCEFALDTIERLDACRSSELCPPRVHR
jgi:uncharacterized protein DUF6184